ncbi:MAG TPA: S41 family peptidase [Candidatus Paceibacterota bacterium]|nr:S41 family peptidase [Candidatus Paceibacterota bacterium]
MQRNKKSKLAVLALVVAGAFAIGLYTGIDERIASAANTAVPTITVNLNPDAQPSGVDFTPLWRAWSLLDQNFVETHASGTIPTDQERVWGAIDGLTNSFGDPYTVFFPPQEATTFNQNIQGEFGGVGMELDVNKDGALVVVSPIKDSPADKAGVLSGDIVAAIDGKTTDGMSVDDAVSAIRGEKGTAVKLTLIRAGAKEPITVSIVRDTIEIPIIKNYMRSNGIYEIELYSFSANSADLFRDALRQFVQSGSNKLILDLRGNPGGYLDAAVDMASYFLPAGDVVVTEDYKGKQDNIVHRSLGYNVFAGKNLEMAVLVDQGSASAAEILSGALQQNGVAKLVGTRTFGKGSVQELMDLGDGAQLKITVARWLTPNGSSISDGGLKPDINATTTPDDISAGRDPQTAAAVSYLLSH